MRHPRPILAAAAVVAASALALAGCSSSGGSSSSRTASKSGSYSSAALSTLTSYTGGTAKAASGTPITLGWVNSQGGSNDYSQYTTAAQNAVALINTQLGGVDGHPIKLDECFVADDDAQGQVCGQKFLNDSNVVGVLQGSLLNGTASLHQALAGKVPVLGTISGDQNDAAAKNAYYLTGGQYATAGLVQYATKFAKAEKVALIGPTGIPIAAQALAGLKAGLIAAGATVTEATYSPGATDYTSTLVASKVKSADLFVPFAITTQQCSAVAHGLQRLGITTPVAGLDLCLTAPLKQALGDYPHWTFLSAAVNPRATSSNPQTAAQISAYENWVKVTNTPDQESSVLSSQLLLTAAQVLNRVQGTPTRASFGAALATLTGPAFLGLGKLTYNATATGRAVGTTASRFYTYQGNGTWKDATDGQVVYPPARSR